MATLSWNGVQYNGIEDFCIQAGITSQKDINLFTQELSKTKSVDSALRAVYSGSGMGFTEENYNGYDRKMEYLEKGRAVYETNRYRNSLTPEGELLNHIRAIRTAALNRAKLFGITEEQAKIAHKKAKEIISILRKSPLFRDLKQTFHFTTMELLDRLWQIEFRVSEFWLLETAEEINEISRSESKRKRLQPVRYYNIVKLAKRHGISIKITKLYKFKLLDECYAIHLKPVQIKLIKQLIGDKYDGCLQSELNQGKYTILDILYKYFDANFLKLHIDMNNSIDYYMDRGGLSWHDIGSMLYKLNTFNIRKSMENISGSYAAQRAADYHSYDIGQALVYAMYLKIEEREHARGKRSNN